MDQDEKSARARIEAGSTTVDDYIEAAVDAYFDGSDGDEWRQFLDRALALPLTPSERGDVLSYKALYTFQLQGECPEALELAENAAQVLEGRRDYEIQWACSAGIIAHLVRTTDPERAARLRSDVLGFIQRYPKSADADPGWMPTLYRIAAQCRRDEGDLEESVKWIRNVLHDGVDIGHVDVVMDLAGDLEELQRYDEAEAILVDMEAHLVCSEDRSQVLKWEREVKVRRARLAANRGQDEKSREMFATLLDELTEADYHYWQALLNLGWYESHVHRYKAAREILERVVAGTPHARMRQDAQRDLRYVRHHQALLDYEEGRRPEAIAEAEALLREDVEESQRTKLLLLLGKAYYFPDIRRYKESYDLLKRVMETAPEAKTREDAREGWLFSRYCLAGLEYQAGRYEAALQECDAVLSQIPAGRLLHDCLLLKAVALVRTKKHRDAESCYVELLNSTDVEPETRARATEYLERLHRELGVPDISVLVEELTSHYGAARYDEAEAALARAETRLAGMRTEPQHRWWDRELEMWRGRIAHKRGEYEKAAAMFRDILRELPGDDARYWTCLDWLGHSDWFCHRYDDAYNSLVRVVTLAPDPAMRAKVREDLVKLRHHRAVAKAKEGRVGEGVDEARALLAEAQDEPSRSRALSLLGWLYMHPDIKKYSEAYEMLTSVVETASEAEMRAKALANLERLRREHL